jgi:putative ABC transport system substrate-binding protein
VPTIYPDLFFAESGGLIAYGANFADEFRSAAGYIDRILKGTKPADLPIEQPNKFDLFINLRAAKAAWSNHPTDAAQESIREDAIILPFLLITRPSCCQTGFAYIIANC